MAEPQQQTLQEDTYRVPPQDVVPLDDIANGTKLEDKDGEGSGGGGSEDGHVESPTTGENYVFKCVFCEKVLGGADAPKLLDCLHDACGTCVSNKMFEHNEGNAKTAVECPSCSLICDTDKIIDNQFLLELAAASCEETSSTKFSDLRCSSCSDNILATSWCVDCAEFICDICVQAHQRLKITKDHTIKPKEEGMMDGSSVVSSISPTNLYCVMHPLEKLSLFCENCDKLTCRDCQLTEHRDHKYKFTHEIAPDARKFISMMLKEVTYKRVLLNSAMKVIMERQTLITDKKQALVNEITQLVVKLTDTIKVRGKQLIARLTEVCESKQKTLQEKKQALEQLSKMTDHCIDFTQYALDTGSDMALLFSKRQVTSHLQRIKCKKADIPNPEIPVRIHLALEKVPELVKVISTIGQIVVDGRVYPSQATSPSVNMLPPHSSPSPGHTRPPQQQSPLNAPSQPAPTVFQNSRMLPPYTPPQQFGPNMSQNIAPKLPQNMQGSTMNQPIPILAQQITHNTLNNLQRMQAQRNQMPQHHHQQRGVMPPNMHRMQNPQQQGVNHQQQQVSSSTHPHGIMPDRGSLRGLLQPNGNAVYIQTAPGQYQAVQPAYVQQYQNRFPGNQQPHFRQQPPQQHGPNNRMVSPNQRAPVRIGFQSPPLAKWHIPQQANDTANMYNNNNNRLNSLPSINENFKITLKSQAVTSTIPKTPSPNQGKPDSENLDNICEASVNDLMATIAKLDSNGVQVLAEGRSKTGGSPHVDSSTGDGIAGPSNIGKDGTAEAGKDDPNEDWCAVCMDGGELVCCDKCPKVFHQFCHIPNLSVEESDTWQCLLCVNFANMPESAFEGERKEGELGPREKKIVERIVLEMYCQYELSLPFREVIGPENTDYHSIIKKPIALDTIRQKLEWSTEDRYRNLIDFIRDVRLMFKNAYTYNEEDTLIYNDAKMLEKFFEEQLQKLLPEYMDSPDDEDIHPPSKKYRRICD